MNNVFTDVPLANLVNAHYALLWLLDAARSKEVRHQHVGICGNWAALLASEKNTDVYILVKVCAKNWDHPLHDQTDDFHGHYPIRWVGGGSGLWKGDQLDARMSLMTHIEKLLAAEILTRQNQGETSCPTA